MGMADIAEVVWNDFLRFNPKNPRWTNRDRFVVSNGHGSMLLYALAYLTGYGLSIDEIRNFRQLGFRTAGHPERDLDIAIETTTGPLGQGVGNAVGMALAERTLAARFNQPDCEIVDHFTYVFLGDGCLMEGVSHEVCSLAGTLGLGKLIAFYDDNQISIDGQVQGWFGDDTPARFRAYGWHVIDDVDGHDAAAIAAAVEAARSETARPSLLCCKTVIGWGAPRKQGTASAHGEALGAEEIAATRANISWPHPPFVIPEAVLGAWNAVERGSGLEAAWNAEFARYTERYPELAAEYTRCMRGELPGSWQDTVARAIGEIARDAKAMATRKASQLALDRLAGNLPELIGGSADLTGSNNTWHAGSRVVSRTEADGNYIHYGVREFGMATVMNGMASHGGLIPYGGTFLVFSDYARSALRMAAMMELRSIFVLTHDSIGLGEDGPTHQPVEHLTALRVIPNLDVWRPCDGVETVVAWQQAIERSNGPSCLVLSRQNLAAMERTSDQIGMIGRGAYILYNSTDAPSLVLLATGSEVALALAAAEALESGGRAVRVVSMPCLEVFEQQEAAYREHVLPPGVPRLAIEAGASACWWRYVGDRGAVVGIDHFGRSAPGPVLLEYFGFSVAAIVEAATRLA